MIEDVEANGNDRDDLTLDYLDAPGTLDDLELNPRRTRPLPDAE